MRAASSTAASTSGRSWVALPNSRRRPSVAVTSVPNAPRYDHRCHWKTSTTKTFSPSALPATPSSPSNSPNEKRRWHVRPIRPEEIVAAAELQARAFYTSYPLGPLDALMFYQFRGEVLSGLQSKMNYSQEHGFVCLVAVADDGGSRDVISDDSNVNDLSSSPPTIAGVVEVSLQAEKRELEALWKATGLAGGTLGSERGFSSTGNGDESECEIADDESTEAAATARGLLFGSRGAGGRAASSPPSAPPSSSPSIPDGAIFDDSYAYVACMAVDERFRRRGAASALLSAAERVAGGGRGWGKNWVLLHVHESNEAARELYASSGYVALGPSERPGIIGAPRVLMGKCSGGGVFGDGLGDFPPSSSSSGSSPSSPVPGGGIVSMPSNLLESLKRDNERRAAAAKKEEAEVE